MNAHNFIDLTGKSFGRLIVRRYLGRNGHPQPLWECQCSCDGKMVNVFGPNLRSGVTVSCGCWREERKITHGQGGHNKSPEYRTWLTMKDRCYNPQHTGFKYYGGKGVVMCDEWRDSFESFLSYVLANLGAKPSPKHSIDRIAGGNYTPGNIRWATKIEQAQNTTKNVNITIDGETHLEKRRS